MRLIARGDGTQLLQRPLRTWPGWGGWLQERAGAVRNQPGQSRPVEMGGRKDAANKGDTFNWVVSRAAAVPLGGGPGITGQQRTPAMFTGPSRAAAPKGPFVAATARVLEGWGGGANRQN